MGCSWMHLLSMLEHLTWKIFFSPLFFMYSLGRNSFKLDETEQAGMNISNN